MGSSGSDPLGGFCFADVRLVPQPPGAHALSSLGGCGAKEAMISNGLGAISGLCDHIFRGPSDLAGPECPGLSGGMGYQLSHWMIRTPTDRPGALVGWIEK